MDQIKKICGEYKLQDHLSHVIEANCMKNDLEEASNGIEVFSRLFEPISDSVIFTLNNCKEILEIMNGDLGNLEIYEQEQEECVDELSQIILEECNEHELYHTRVSNIKFDPLLHQNYLNSIKLQTKGFEKESKSLEKKLSLVEEEIESFRSILIDLSGKSASLNKELENLDELLKNKQLQASKQTEELSRVEIELDKEKLKKTQCTLPTPTPTQKKSTKKRGRTQAREEPSFTAKRPFLGNAVGASRTMIANESTLDKTLQSDDEDYFFDD